MRTMTVHQLPSTDQDRDVRRAWWSLAWFIPSLVSAFLPGLPAYARGVTVRQLLNHTGGLPDYEDFVPDSQTAQVHDAWRLHYGLVRRAPALRPPVVPSRHPAPLHSRTRYSLLFHLPGQFPGVDCAGGFRRNKD